eukprot:scaffold92283_cov75-Phaeocystis_antarctica.AAC.8
MRCQPAPWLQAEAPRLGVEKPPDGEAAERIRSNQGVAVCSSTHTVQHGEARCRACLCRAAVRARMAGGARLIGARGSSKRRPHPTCEAQDCERSHLQSRTEATAAFAPPAGMTAGRKRTCAQLRPLQRPHPFDRCRPRQGSGQCQKGAVRGPTSSDAAAHAKAGTASGRSVASAGNALVRRAAGGRAISGGWSMFQLPPARAVPHAAHRRQHRRQRRLGTCSRRRRLGHRPPPRPAACNQTPSRSSRATRGSRAGTRVPAATPREGERGTGFCWAKGSPAASCGRTSKRFLGPTEAAARGAGWRHPAADRDSGCSR